MSTRTKHFTVDVNHKICEHENKRLFYTKETARKACRSLSKSVRIYQCEHDKTHYHVTKQYATKY